MSKELVGGSEPSQTDPRLEQALWRMKISPTLQSRFTPVGIITVADLLDRTEDDLMAIPQFGGKCLAQTKLFLMRHGFALKQG